jgi:tetratricopeptide (TPR) repeat protein
VALLGTLGLAARFDFNEFDARARKARTPEAIIALEKELPPPDSIDAYGGFGSVVQAWQRAGRPGDAIRVVEEWREQIARLDGDDVVSDAKLRAESSYGDALAYAGRVDDAVAAATRLLDGAMSPRCLQSVDDGPNWAQVAFEDLARLHERRGDYEQAIRWYGRWHGSSGSPVFRRIATAQRGTCVARCRWRMGQPDAALDLAFASALLPFELVVSDDPFVWACEIAVRSGKLGDLRKRIDGVSDPQKRCLFERSFAVASAFAARDAKAMLDALAVAPDAPVVVRFLRPDEGRFVANYLREMGPAAVAQLVARVRRGDGRAIDVAVRGYVPEALPALRVRRDAEDITRSERERLDAAIDEIESAVPPH